MTDEQMHSKAKTFEELHTYVLARALTNRIYEITRRPAFARDLGLCDQIRRAAVSIMSNIAEGYERGSNTELIQFLYIAKGSGGEVRAELTIALDQKYVDTQTYVAIYEQCRQVSGMLSNFISYLKGSPYQGSKFKRPPRKTMAEEVNDIVKRVQQQKHESSDT